MNNDEILQRVQESIDNIADGISNQNIMRARQLKIEILNIGAVRENLKRASKDAVAQNSTSNNSKVCHALSEYLQETGHVCAEPLCAIVNFSFIIGAPYDTVPWSSMWKPSRWV